MQVIKVTDFTSNHLAVSAADGEDLNKVIVDHLKKKTPVSVDFVGIDLIISAFLNPAIGKLYGQFSSEEIRALVKIVHMSNDDAQLLKIVIEHAKKRFDSGYPEQDDSLDMVNED